PASSRTYVAPPRSTLFPYTTLFRSRHDADRRQRNVAEDAHGELVATHHLLHQQLAGIRRRERDRRRQVGLAQRPEHADAGALARSEEHTSELSHVKISYAVFCLKKKKEVNTMRRDRMEEPDLQPIGKPDELITDPIQEV